MAYSWILTDTGIDRGSDTCLSMQVILKLSSQEIQLCVQFHLKYHSTFCE